MVQRMILASAALATLLFLPAMAAPKAGTAKSAVASCCATKTRCCDKVEFCCDQPDKAECCLKGVACCDKEPCCGPATGARKAVKVVAKSASAKKLAAKSCCAPKTAKKG